MELACDLEVDVNGEGTFFLDKKILSSFSGRLIKLLSKTTAMSAAKPLKVVLHGLPGGPETFEHITKFCYDNGKIHLTPANTCLLHCAAHFMEMAGGGSSPSSSPPSLIEETEKSIEGIPYWTWSEIVNALKQCQDFFPLASSAGVLERLLDSLVARIMTPTDTSPSSSSPDSSGIRFSFDTRSTVSTKNGHHRTWWFQDLVCFGPQMVEKGTRIMMSRKLDHVSISRFLFYYLKARLANATPEEKREATETVVDLLCSLDRGSVSCRSLLWILRVSSSSRNLSKCCRSRLESMIGVRIDQVTLDDLLVPAQPGMEGLYDVDLIVRFLESFLCSGGREAVPRLRKVGSLMDLYLPEVAPDSGLKPAKFAALATALPEVARDSHDEMYRAIDMYLEVHARLSEEEKMKICCAINYEKLSMESSKHLTQNTKFPSRTAIRALVSQQSKLKSLLKDGNNLKSFGREEYPDKGEPIVLYAKKLDLSVENEKLRANLQGMQWRVMELEKVCRRMQSQMSKMTKAKVASHGGSRSLPRLCS